MCRYRDLGLKFKDMAPSPTATICFYFHFAFPPCHFACLFVFVFFIFHFIFLTFFFFIVCCFPLLVILAQRFPPFDFVFLLLLFPIPPCDFIFFPHFPFIVSCTMSCTSRLETKSFFGV
jgi:hypothetical protein